MTQNVLDKKSWCTLLFTKCFDTKNLQKNKSVTLRNSLALSVNKWWKKIMPLLREVLWNPKFSETIKRAPSKFFSWIQRVFNILCDTHLWIIEHFASGTWVAPQLSSNTKTFRNIKRTPSLLLRYRDIKTKKFAKLWWHHAKIYGNFCARETKNVNFNVFSAFVCFRPIFWREGKAHFISAHSFF